VTSRDGLTETESAAHAAGHAAALQEINAKAARTTHFHYYDDGGMGPCSITQFNVDDDPNEIAGSRQVVQGESFTDVLDRLAASGGW